MPEKSDEQPQQLTDSEDALRKVIEDLADENLRLRLRVAELEAELERRR